MPEPYDHGTRPWRSSRVVAALVKRRENHGYTQEQIASADDRWTAHDVRTIETLATWATETTSRYVRALEKLDRERKDREGGSQS